MSRTNDQKANYAHDALESCENFQNTPTRDLHTLVPDLLVCLMHLVAEQSPDQCFADLVDQARQQFTADLND